MKNMLMVIDNVMSAQALLEKSFRLLPDKLIVLGLDDAAVKEVIVFLDELKYPSCELEIINISDVFIKNKAEKVIEVAGQYNSDTVLIYRQNIANKPKDFSFEKTLLKGLQKTNLVMCSDRAWKTEMKLLSTIDINSKDSEQIKLNSVVFDVSSKLACRVKAALHLMSVIAISRVSEELDIVESSEVVSKKGEDVKAELDRFTKQKNMHENCTTHVVAGLPYKEIPSFAKKQKMDLAILGNVGRSGLKGLIVGNTVEKILQKLSVDVLVVKNN